MNKKLKYSISFIILFMLLIATACNAENGSSSENNTSDLKDVTVGYGLDSINITLFYSVLPSELGWYEDEGLNMELLPAESASTTIQLLLSGEIDMGLMPIGSAVQSMINDDSPLTVVYPVERRDGNSISVKADSEIKEISDLEGKTIGYDFLGSGSEGYGDKILNENDVPINSIDKVAIGLGAQAYESVENGEVDAFITFAANSAQAIGEGYDFRQFPPSDWQEKQFYYTLVTTDDFIENNGDIIEGVGKSISKSFIFAETDRDATLDVFFKLYPDHEPNDSKGLNVQKEMLNAAIENQGDLPLDFEWGSMDEEDLAFTQENLVKTNMISEDETLDPAEIFDNRFEKSYTDFDVEDIVKQTEEWSDK